MASPEACAAATKKLARYTSYTQLLADIGTID